MASLFGGSTKVIPEFTGLQVNTSVQVMPIPIIYGAPRIQINLIYYNGFTASKVKTGGKGVLSGGKGSSEIQYNATIMMAIGEGPTGTTHIIYQDANVFIPSDYPTNGAVYYNGTDNQPVWNVIEALWPNDARPYKYTSYYGFYNAQLDSSATVPQIDMVVGGIASGTCPLYNSTIEITTGQYDNSGNALSYIGPINIGTADADPAVCIYDFLTNWRYGATFPAEWVDTSTLFSNTNGLAPGLGDPSVSSFCQAIGLGWSVVINNAESASSILERWCKNLNVAIVWDGALLKFIPYWDAYAGDNPGWDSSNGIPPKYYRPLTQSMITISMDDILQSENKDEDPISYSRKDPQEVYNTVRVDFKDRFNFYNDVPAEQKDEAHIELYGPRIDNIGLANEFSLSQYASLSALMQLRRNIAIMRTFTWRMSPLWAWIGPMYVITIPDPANYGQSVIVRVVSVEDDSDENITITAEEFPVGTASPTNIPMAQTTPPDTGAVNSPAQASYEPVIFEPTVSLQSALGYATPVFVFGDSGGTNGTLDPNWGGCNIWISLDGVNYEQIDTLHGPSTVGVTTSLMPAYSGANPDTGDSISVFLGMCAGTLNNSSDAAAAAGQSICVIADINGYEIFSYTTALLSTPFEYTLTGLYRGLFGTTARTFAPGAQFMYIGSNSNKVIDNLPATFVGQNFYVKAQSFSVFGNIEQDLADCIPYEYFVGGAGAGGGLAMADAAISSDAFFFPYQHLGSVAVAAVSSDSFSAVVAYMQSLSDTAASVDTISVPGTWNNVLSDSIASVDQFSGALDAPWFLNDGVTSSDALTP